MKVKNEHFVPKMYLKHFISPQDGFCVWNLMNNKILSHQNLDNYAAIRYFYDADEKELNKAMQEVFARYPSTSSVDLSDIQFLEKALARMESDIDSIWGEICSDSELLYKETNMQKLIIFFHTLAYRTEKYRELIDNICTQTKSHLEKTNIYPCEINKVAMTGKENQLYQLLSLTPLENTAHMLLEQYDWFVGKASGINKLIISDNPAQGIVTGFNDICMPLNSEKAIIFKIKDKNAPTISKDIPNGNEIILSEISVASYNLIQCSYAKRFVFGDKTSLWMAKLLLNSQNQK